MNETYKIIEDLCRSRGIDITTMCKKAGISRAILSEFKMGRTAELSTKTLTKIADFFNVSIDYLLGNEKEPVQTDELDNEMTEILQEFKDNPELRTLFSLSRKATPEQLRQYTKVIKALRGNGDE